MAITQPKVSEIIEPVVEKLSESERFYQTAARNLNHTDLQDLFRERAGQRADFAEALREEELVDVEAGSGLDIFDFLHRGMITVKAAMTIRRDRTDQVVLEESRTHEKALLDVYEEALAAAERMPESLVDELRRQSGSVRAAYTNVGAMLERNQPVVIALFRDMEEVQRGIAGLERLGLARERISILADEEAVGEVLHDQRAEQAQEGAGAAAVGGGAFGSLVGYVIGASMTLSMGPILLIGLPAVVTTTAVTAGIGAAYGGLFGALLGWGVAEDDIHAYITGVREGQLLLVVLASPEEAADTAALLREMNGQRVEVRHETVVS